MTLTRRGSQGTAYVENAFPCSVVNEGGGEQFSPAPVSPAALAHMLSEANNIMLI